MDEHFARVLAAPSASGKRPRAEEGAGRGSTTTAAVGGSARSAKRRQRRDAETESGAALLARAESAAAAGGSIGASTEPLDARAIKSMTQALERAIRQNAMLRTKHADAPAKFMDSEVALDAELRRWTAVAAAPELFDAVIAHGVAPLLLGLLSHENLDVRLDVINLLADLTDIDEDPAALAPTRALAEHLVGLAFLPLLVRTLDDLERESVENEREVSRPAGEADENGAADANPHATGVFHALQLIENLVDVLPTAASTLCSDAPVIFATLLRMLGAKREFSANKLYASEILSILIQASPENRMLFLSRPNVDDQAPNDSKNGSGDHLDHVLRALAPYRKRDPQDEEEEELVENLLNILCSLLMEREGQDQFRRLEGLELMLRYMKDRKQFVFTGALRVLDHALTNHARNCERLVEIGGLKSIFPVFMGKKSAKRKENRVKELENVTSLVASLCLLLRKDAKHDVFARFHAKFLENDMEKVDRLVDLFVKYHGQVAAAASRQDEDEEDERYLRRLDAGLFVLQRVALAVAHVCRFSCKLRAYVMVKCHERSVDVEAIRDVLVEQKQLMDEEDHQNPSNESVATLDPVTIQTKSEQVAQIRLLVASLGDEIEQEHEQEQAHDQEQVEAQEQQPHLTSPEK